jgi:hypothetical protein
MTILTFMRVPLPQSESEFLYRQSVSLGDKPLETHDQ